MTMAVPKLHRSIRKIALKENARLRGCQCCPNPRLYPINQSHSFLRVKPFCNSSGSIQTEARTFYTTPSLPIIFIASQRDTKVYNTSFPSSHTSPPIHEPHPISIRGAAQVIAQLAHPPQQGTFNLISQQLCELQDS